MSFFTNANADSLCRDWYSRNGTRIELSEAEEADMRAQMQAISAAYPEFSEISLADNARFITLKEETDKFYELLDGATDEQLGSREFMREMLDREAKIGRLFFDAENAILKELNDSVLPEYKGFVTTLLSAYKKMLWDRVQTTMLPDGTPLSRYIVGQYADAKNIRFAFNRDDPHIKEAVLRAYREASQDLAQLIYNRDSVLAARFLPAPGIARDPASINLAGYDEFDPDFAGSAARRARSRFRQDRVDDDINRLGASFAAADDGTPEMHPPPDRIGGTDPVRFTDVKVDFDKAAKTAETTRLRMQMRFGRKYPKLMQEYVVNDNVDIPSRELFEIMLKTKIPKDQKASKLNFLMAMQKEIRERFGYELDVDELELIYTYKNSVDQFSPGNYITNRDPVDYNDFEYGLLLVDMTGQNVRNFEQTAIAVSETVWNRRGTAQMFDSRDIIRRARQGERTATQDLAARQEYIYTMMKKHFDCKKLPISGDDGACVPKAPITEAQKRAFLNEIAAHPEYSGNFRLSFVEPVYYHPTNGKPLGTNLNSFAYEQFSGTAEAVEKEMRKALRKRLTNIIDYDEVQKLLLAVDVKPFDREYPIRVFDYPGSAPRTIYRASGSADIHMGGFEHLKPEQRGQVYSMIREVFTEIARANGLDPRLAFRLRPGSSPLPPTSVRNYGIRPLPSPDGFPPFANGVRTAPSM